LTASEATPTLAGIMTTPARLVFATVLVVAVAAPATRAAAAEGGRDAPPMGRVAVRRGVQSPEGLFTVRLNLFISASEGSFGKPTSIAPDLYYGVSDALQIGLLHTGPMGWQTMPGAGLCITGTGGGCPHVYDNVGFDLMYGLLRGNFHLSFHTSVYLFRISAPLWVMWTAGFTGKLHFTDAVAILFSPQIGVALTHRDVNEDQFFVPLELQFQVGQAVSLKILSGASGQLSAFADTVRVPLGLGLVGNVSKSFDLGLRGSFDNLLGHQAPGVSRTDERSIGVLAVFRT
jgi:hypothetical protein